MNPHQHAGNERNIWIECSFHIDDSKEISIESTELWCSTRAGEAAVQNKSSKEERCTDLLGKRVENIFIQKIKMLK